MEKEFAQHKARQKIIQDSHGFISKVLEYQIEVNEQAKRLNNDVNSMVKNI